METSNNNLNNKTFLRKIWTEHKRLTIVVGILLFTCCGIPGLLALAGGIAELIYGARPDSEVVERVEKLEASESKAFSPIDIEALKLFIEFRKTAASVDASNSFLNDYRALVSRIEKLLKTDIDGFKSLAEKDSALLTIEEIDLLDGFENRLSVFDESDSIRNYGKSVLELIKNSEPARRERRRIAELSREQDRLRAEFQELVKPESTPKFEDFESIKKRLETLKADLNKAAEDKEFRKEVTGMQKSIDSRIKEINGLIVAGPEPEGEGQIAVARYLRRNLNDYDSSEFLAWTKPILVTIKGQPVWRVSLRLRAKNAFGAYIVRTPTFYIADNTVIAVDGL
jgi:hypothetical protein